MNALLATMWVLGAAGPQPEAPWESPPLLTADGELTSAPEVAAPRAEREHHPLGVQLDVGVPDGAGVGLVVTPLRWLRLSLAGLTSGAAAGARLSATVMPWQGTFRPTLTVEGGHYFPGNVAALLNLEGTAAGPLSQVQYDYGTAALGFELGSARLSFVLRAGVSYLTGSLGGVSLGQTTTAPIQLRSVLPSLKLGVLLCFG